MQTFEPNFKTRMKGHTFAKSGKKEKIMGEEQLTEKWDLQHGFDSPEHRTFQVNLTRIIFYYELKILTIPFGKCYLMIHDLNEFISEQYVVDDNDTG